VDCDVQTWRTTVALLLVDELVDQGCAPSSRFCMLGWLACRGVMLDFVEPVLQTLRVTVKLYCDLAESVDSSAALRVLVMEPAASLLAAEIERHCTGGSDFLATSALLRGRSLKHDGIDEGSRTCQRDVVWVSSRTFERDGRTMSPNHSWGFLAGCAASHVHVCCLGSGPSVVAAPDQMRL
jgi:hypothetical protein